MLQSAENGIRLRGMKKLTLEEFIDIFRSHGARGGKKAAANMTAKQRIERARKAGSAKRKAKK